MDEGAIEDLFGELGPVRVRRMFGGFGVYREGLMFAIVAQAEIFLKVDEVTRPLFEAARSRPFTYLRRGEPVALSYWRLPDEALDDPLEIARWAAGAVAAASRARDIVRRRSIVSVETTDRL